MAINNSTLRSDIFTEIKSFLTAASLSASDPQNPSLSVTLKGMYSNKDKGSLPVIAIGGANPDSDGRLFFDSDGFSAQREVRVPLQLYTSAMTHLDQITDQVDNAFQTGKIDGITLIGLETDDELTLPNDNKAHRRNIFLTFKKS